MFRIFKLSNYFIEQWRQERMRVGQTRYGNRDLKRYNLVDVTEELLDALNIMERMVNRGKYFQKGFYSVLKRHISCYKIEETINEAILLIRELDKNLPDEFCTDENGDERIWVDDVKGFFEGIEKLNLEEKDA